MKYWPLLLYFLLLQQPAPVRIDGPPVAGDSATITRFAFLVVPGVYHGHTYELGSIEGTGEIRVNPIVGRVCSISRFRRNLLAAKNGSRKASKYLDLCAYKLKLKGQ